MRTVAPSATSKFTEGSRSPFMGGRKLLTKLMMPMPAASPRYPAIAVMSKLSATIMRTMADGVAPIALRMPISCVRSLTEISMMLETPTMPARSVPIPTSQMNARIQTNMRLILE